MGDADIGVIGLAVMGSNLARNLESRGLKVAVYNRTSSVTEEFMQKFGSGRFVASSDLRDFCASLNSPKKIILMVKAGNPVDMTLEQLEPFLDAGDVVADGGNTYYRDTQRREKKFRERGIHFLGIGISGGEEGALNGPSIMPGGPKAGWELFSPVLDAIAAQVDGPCTAYMGPDGAGHFVKMVHNGIEYGDMQLIAESYHLLREVAGHSPTQISKIFSEWNKGRLSSYLMEITASILLRKDEFSEGYLIDEILDKAGQKGTGRWTVELALDFGVAVPSISSAVDARVLSAMKEFRLKANKTLHVAEPKLELPANFVELLEAALFLSKSLCYAQGMELLKQASEEEKWSLRLDEVARIWKGGCIIRAEFLERIREAYTADSNLENLILDPGLKEDTSRAITPLRQVLSIAALSGVPTPSMSASLSYIESLRRADLPQNLTQAQRDYFGAHTYERIDREGVFHSEWESLPLVSQDG